MKTLKLGPWPGGANNLSSPELLPDGFVRELINIDASAQGVLAQRAQAENILPISGVRSAINVGHYIVIACDKGLISYNTRDGSHETIGAPLPAGSISAVEHAGEAFMAVADRKIRTNGVSVREWGHASPSFSIAAIPGNLNGIVKVAVTSINDEESGSQIKIIRLKDQAVRISSAAAGVLRVYVSQPDQSTLYSQGVLIGSMAVNSVSDKDARLVTGNKIPMPTCGQYVSHHSMIIGSLDNFLFISEPMMPHLYDPVKGFISIESPITMIASTDGGVFVATDYKTYFLSGLEGADMNMREVLHVGAVKGTGSSLPEGIASWFTRYGQAIGTRDGSITLPSRNSYAPELADIGNSGLIYHGGNEIAITTMRGPAKSPSLSIGDFSDLEINDE